MARSGALSTTHAAADFTGRLDSTSMRQNPRSEALEELFKGFQETDEIPDLIRLQPKFRHAWMTRRHPFGECIFECFYRVLLVKASKRWRGGAGASADLFNRMAV